ncbi:unnamed protein product [Rotaria socialis]|uniref:Uncharacterized protein n=1 Tax=Rotaria socialis TaxID=392032 RepID=A0A821ASN0_9BILA|nr:unnamed protein product [Rotaria socialis]CAF4582269.1 unnamed protein product [Rotaria socialis]
MGNKSTTQIYNSTKETVKILLHDTENNPTDTIIGPREIWSKETAAGWNTVMIIPLNDNQERFSYSLESNKNLIIKRKLEKLILVPSINSPTVEMDLTLGNYKSADYWWNCPPQFNAELLGLGASGCLVFNESNESIRVRISDFNDRNTDMILAHGEHNIVQTPRKMTSTTVVVSVLDFNLVNTNNNIIARAKYSMTRYMYEYHGAAAHGAVLWYSSWYNFLRIIKKDGYFVTEQARTIEAKDLFQYARQNVPFSSLLSREFNGKV